jgi:hypothetical protein
MEKKFLCYLLYAALIDIRERGLENGDSVSYWLANLVHNAPLVLAEGDNGLKGALTQIVDRVEHDHMGKWLENRKQEFLERYPEFK